MTDGPISIEAPTSQPLRELPNLPENLLQVLAGVQPELSALEAKPRFPTKTETHSFGEGLIQNAQVLLAHEREIRGLLDVVTNQSQPESVVDSLLLAAISTDFGKLGSDRVTPGEIPNNVVARIYREYRWDNSHVDWLSQADNFSQIEPQLSNLSAEQIDLLKTHTKGRTVIPLNVAVEVMKRVAMEKNPAEQLEEIESTFSLTEADEAELARFGLSGETPLSQVFTALHCRANAELLPKIAIPLPDRDYACGHHLPAGIGLLPAAVVERHHLDGSAGADEVFMNYVANTAILVVTDRLQGFVQRSGEDPKEAFELTFKGILKDIDNNFHDHPLRETITNTYIKVLAFAQTYRLAEYYAS